MNRVQGSAFGVQAGEGREGRALLLTPPGSAAIAVVRLTGPGVARFLDTHFSKPAKAGRCVHGTLSDGARVIDDPVVVLHPDGLRADVNLHGGPWVVRSALELARREGFDVSERVELPLPDEAVDAGTELGREVLRYLPIARTELTLRVLLAQEEAWASLKAQVCAGTTLLLPSAGEGRGEGEAQEVRQRNFTTPLPPPAPHPNPLPRRGEGTGIGAILADRSLHWLLHPPRVAIVGVPNVGKSTLANQLFAQERSITADLPGTTRDWVGEIANIDGLAAMLVDTPGLRETEDEIEREAIRRAGAEVHGADLIVLVIDASQDDRAQTELLRRYPHALLVANKVDRPAAGEFAQDLTAIRTVATTGEGVDALRRAIRRHFLGADQVEVTKARWWTQRQREVLERARVDPSALSDL